METKMNKFIMTEDLSTINILKNNGFQLLNKIGNSYIFLNEGKKSFVFSEIDASKVVFTNKMFF